MFSLQQAVTASPILAQVTERVRRSQQMMRTITPLQHPARRSKEPAGPLDEEGWCLLVGNPAVGTKLKQLTPALMAALRQADLGVPRLRIKVRLR
jgi:hypothetical protein